MSTPPSGPPVNPFPRPQPVPASVLNHLSANWKSTASNLLTLIVVTGMYFAAIPSQVLQQHGVTQNEAFWGTVIVGLAKLYIALITKDAQ